MNKNEQQISNNNKKHLKTIRYKNELKWRQMNKTQNEQKYTKNKKKTKVNKYKHEQNEKSQSLTTIT